MYLLMGDDGNLGTWEGIVMMGRILLRKEGIEVIERKGRGCMRFSDRTDLTRVLYQLNYSLYSYNNPASRRSGDHY
jgi:hypothetical protein